MTNPDPPSHDNVTLSERDQRIITELEKRLTEDAPDPFSRRRRTRWRQQLRMRLWRYTRRHLLLKIGQISLVMVASVSVLCAGLLIYGFLVEQFLFEPLQSLARGSS